MYVPPFSGAVLHCHLHSEDFSHKGTFGGHATTVDFCSANSEKHIMGNICELRFKKPIAAVFMELFQAYGPKTVVEQAALAFRKDPQSVLQYIPCVEDKIRAGKTALSIKVDIDNNLMPNAIRNLANQMVLGAPLAIEHIPFTNNEGAVEQNPFMLCVKPFMLLLREMFWYQHNEPFQPDFIQNNLLKRAVLSIQNAMATVIIPIGMVECKINKKVFINLLKASSEMASSEFSNSIGVIVAIEYQRSQQSQPGSPINTFLASLGFKDIRHERVAVNPYNGRHNSWMITATKG